MGVLCTPRTEHDTCHLPRMRGARKTPLCATGSGNSGTRVGSPGHRAGRPVPPVPIAGIRVRGEGCGGTGRGARQRPARTRVAVVRRPSRSTRSITISIGCPAASRRCPRGFTSTTTVARPLARSRGATAALVTHRPSAARPRTRQRPRPRPPASPIAAHVTPTRPRPLPAIAGASVSSHRRAPGTQLPCAHVAASLHSSPAPHGVPSGRGTMAQPTPAMQVASAHGPPPGHATGTPGAQRPC